VLLCDLEACNDQKSWIEKFSGDEVESVAETNEENSMEQGKTLAAHQNSEDLRL
jgi:hypothetical protein